MNYNDVFFPQPTMYYKKLPIPKREYIEPSSCPRTGVTTSKPPANTGILDPTATPKPSENFPFHTLLDQTGDYHLYWKVNSTHITFETHVRTLGYVGFGLSSNGKMFPSDVVIGWVKDGVTDLKVCISLFVSHTDKIKTFIKADMNSDIRLQTAAIFFLTNFYLKQGIGKVYVMVDFICIGFL